MSESFEDDYTRAEHALTFIHDNADREIWVQVGMALKDGLAEAGLDLWKIWSSTAHNYDEKTCESSWRNFKPGKITFATVFGLAKANGWQPRAPSRKLTPEERAAKQAEREAKAKAVEQTQAERKAKTQKWATDILTKALSKPKESHPYLVRKGFADMRVPIYRGNLKLRSWGGEDIPVDGCFIVPLRDFDGVLQSLEFIGNDVKLYLPGPRDGGVFCFPRRPVNGDPIMLGEGVATMLSVHAANPDAIVVAGMDANGLVAAAEEIRKRFPNSVLTICADHDAAGLKAANKAAEHGATIIVPETPGDDFNDVHAKRGLDAVAKASKPPIADSAIQVQTNLQRTGNGSVRNNLYNAEQLVGLYVRQKNWTLAFEQFSSKVLLNGRSIQDDDYLTLTYGIQRDCDAGALTPQTVREACRLVARNNSYNEVHQYLDQLKWDGIPRLDAFFDDVFSTGRNEYFDFLGRFLFVTMVARAANPGCDVRNMVVLQGGQRTGKTTALKIIGGKFYREVTSDIHNKDFMQQLAGAWIVELSEMSSFKRSTNEDIKRAVSRTVDVFRPAYGIELVEQPRVCVLAGTTNRDDWITDETGGERFLPATVSTCNFDLLKANRDQYFAEAVHLFRSGWSWWNIPDEAKEQQEARFDEDSITNVIRDWLDSQVIQFVTTTDILSQCLKLELSKHDRGMQTRVGIAMSRMTKWKRCVKETTGRKRTRGWKLKTEI